MMQVKTWKEFLASAGTVQAEVCREAGLALQTPAAETRSL